MTEPKLFEGADLSDLIGGIEKDAKAGKSKKAAPPAAPAKVAKPAGNAREIAARKLKAHKYAPGEMRCITVQKDKGKGGDRPVPVCYNGRQFTVPRGVKTQVPAPVAEILTNAEETVVEWDGIDTLNQRPTPSYPTRVHSE